MNLDAILNGVESEKSMEKGALKVGMYDVAIEKVEEKQNKNGGKALNFQLRVVGANCTNAVVFDRINYDLPNSPEAQRIGLGRLKRISELCGSTDVAQMIGKKLTVNVGVRKSVEYGDQNNVKGYFPLDNTAISNNTTPTITADSIPF